MDPLGLWMISPHGKIWVYTLSPSFHPFFRRFSPLFSVDFLPLALLPLWATADEFLTMLKPPDWYHNDCLTASYEPIPVTTIGAIVIAAGDGILFTGFPPSSLLSDHFPEPTILLQWGQPRRLLPLDEADILKPPWPSPWLWSVWPIVAESGIIQVQFGILLSLQPWRIDSCYTHLCSAHHCFLSFFYLWLMRIYYIHLSVGCAFSGVFHYRDAKKASLVCLSFGS